MDKKYICLRCPRGCEVTTTLDNTGQITRLEGNMCRLGDEYVRSEISDPRRILCSTVEVRGGNYPLVPVWTEKPIPKDKLLELAVDLKGIVLEAPVQKDQVVISNWNDTGINIITSDSVSKKIL